MHTYTAFWFCTIYICPCQLVHVYTCSHSHPPVRVSTFIHAYLPLYPHVPILSSPTYPRVCSCASTCSCSCFSVNLIMYQACEPYNQSPAPIPDVRPPPPSNHAIIVTNLAHLSCPLIHIQIKCPALGVHCSILLGVDQRPPPYATTTPPGVRCGKSGSLVVGRLKRRLKNRHFMCFTPLKRERFGISPLWLTCVNISQVRS